MGLCFLAVVDVVQYSATTQPSHNLEFGVKFGLGNTDFAPNNKIAKGTCTRVQVLESSC